MALMVFLVIFPLVAAVLIPLTRDGRVRRAFVAAASFVVAAASVWLLAANIGGGHKRFAVHMASVEYAMTAILLLMSAYIIYAGVRDKKYAAVVLAALQALSTVASEFVFGGKAEAENALFIDNLSLLMVLLIGVVGSLICVFSAGYMEKYHHHKNVADKSRTFFATVFIFISAMFGLSLSNSLLWLLFFWEVTTFCSWRLIGYSGSEEAGRNAYRALVLNLVGGLAFLAGIVWLYRTRGVVELDRLLAENPAAVAVPAVLIVVAGLVKAAQMPFSSWLLGAMVAPSPVSALLHSSTMVKAGVYLIVRLSPLLRGTRAGLFVAILGAATFLFAAFIAVSERNIKRLLAYSTVSTLGLIVTCAGVGTYQAIWAAMLLMLFHAVAKALLFLCAGTVEGAIGSLSIEDMDGLILRMPKVTACLIIGIAGMFIAPFGMLVSKWQALETLISADPLLAIVVIFGSSATLFFYTKLMGKLIMILRPAGKPEEDVTGGEWFALGALSGLTVAACLSFPLVSDYLIDPFILYVYSGSVSMSRGNLVIMLLMMVFILLLPLQIFLQGRDKRRVLTYLGGANIEEYTERAEANTHFYTGGHDALELKLSNYYMDEFFGEKKLWRAGIGLTTGLLAVLCGVVFL